MTRTEATRILREYERLYHAYVRANWHPKEQPPDVVIHWISSMPLLLSFYRRILTEGITEEAG